MSGQESNPRKTDDSSTQREGLSRELPGPLPTTEVYNLTVLLETFADGRSVARAANLSLPKVEASTAREALSTLVHDAKQLIGEYVAQDRPLPWITPAEIARKNEKRLMVPLHL